MTDESNEDEGLVNVEEEGAKLAICLRLRELEERGAYLSRQYTANDSLESLRMELALQRAKRARQEAEAEERKRQRAKELRPLGLLAFMTACAAELHATAKRDEARKRVETSVPATRAHWESEVALWEKAIAFIHGDTVQDLLRTMLPPPSPNRAPPTDE
jgi:hypothetical protein